MEENINPYYLYKEKRRSNFTIENNIYNFYCYEEIDKILKNPFWGKEFSKKKKNVIYSLIDIDDPLHSKIRKIIAPFFSANYVNCFEDTINNIVDKTINEIKEKEKIDIVKNFGLIIPIEAISKIIGLPKFYNDDIEKYAYEVTDVCDLDFMNEQDFMNALKSHDLATYEISSFLSDVIDYKKNKPGEDLISYILQDGQLSPGEILALCSLLLIAGFQTTSDLISSSIYHICQNKNIKNYIVNNYLADHQLNELIRYDTPVQRVMRVAKSDTILNINNQEIKFKKDQIVFLHLGSANRDEKVFENPDVLDFDRMNSKKHLSFAAGMHLCLGLFLAKREIKISVEKLFKEFPSIEIIDCKWKTSKSFRGLEKLYVSMI
ncbi:MAG: cytochrome P450 [Bacteroidetes bacterium]|nr:cytochrome P450 [Bacteroidota bacterium]